jgi:hypothetical protein
LLHALHTTCFNPPTQILTLANIETLEIATALDNGFHTRTSYADTASDGEVSQFEEVQRDATERCV